MKKINKNDGVWIRKAGYSKKVFLDDKELGKPGIFFQQLKIKPGQIAKNHYHKKQTEIFYFLNNKGYFVVNGKKIVVKKGDILVIEPGDEHEVVNNSKEDFLYLAFKFDVDSEDFYWV
jgi:quercetin dioxygenase-like cupin family protein